MIPESHSGGSWWADHRVVEHSERKELGEVKVLGRMGKGEGGGEMGKNSNVVFLTGARTSRRWRRGDHAMSPIIHLCCPIDTHPVYLATCEAVLV